MKDLLLAAGHHLAAFTLVAALGAQALLLRLPLRPDTLRLLARTDLVYGVAAAAVLGLGGCRVMWDGTAKGAAFYAASPLFWAKLAVFAAVGLLSVFPTLRFRRWARQPQAIPPEQAASVRRCVMAELALLPLLPILAAALARSG
ncbi:DUF2214 family protein [Novispirillum itersonii]|uniref:Putative membrane protein n=1 Tax=Novispirillum itersonii TaxID=189 RepID=A0A7W9ZF13_NOVIT|nr:DUF2214 family protein [Novispirillum itersonii]MBB6210307.1 putative membrane protein [Novispirillum itersonii]